MRVEAVIQRARELGVTLSVDGDRLRYSPKSRTPDDLVDALRLHKEEVLEYLAKDFLDSAPEAIAELLGWASELAEEVLVLDVPIEYVEAPLREITTVNVSRRAAEYLKTISFARLQRDAGGWPPWTPEWWRRQEEDAVRALRGLRHSLAGQGGQGVRT